MNNLSKILSYIQNVAKSDIYIDGKVLPVNNKSIKLSYTFFNSDNCNSCGCCCVPESNVYTQFEYDNICNITPEYVSKYGLDYKYIDKLKSNLKPESHIINDKNINVYNYRLDKNILYLPNKGRNIDRCSWVYESEPGKFLCHIHLVRSVTCRMPHMRIQHNYKSNSTTIGTIQFGRNWAVKCPINLNEPKSKIEFDHNKSNNLSKLNYLLAISLDLNIETYLPDIINYINKLEYDNYKAYLGINMLPNLSHLF